MKSIRLSKRVAWLVLLSIVGLALPSGCAPPERAELATFVKDLLLNAAAAWLL